MDSPDDIPVPLDSRVLGAMLRPLASKTVTVIVGFTERDELGRYYNAAAVYSGGSVLGIYRKQHVAIRRSRYTSGRETQIFNSTVGTLGILICRDSVDAGLASTLVQRGARILCIPTNNAMPRDRGGPHLVDEIRVLDAQYAMTLGVPVIRADVVGATGGLVSAGASMITPPTRAQRCANGSEDGELIVAELP